MISAADVQIQNNPSTSQATQPKATSALTSDFETFLKMLTAQARNQDPLKPIDSTEYAAQLAQFSMVEQQVRTNELLAGFNSTLGGHDLGRLAGWVGMEVQAAVPTRFDGAPVAVLPSPAAAANAAYLVVRDAAGEMVDRVAIPVSTEPLTWNGRDAAGNVFPAGIYSFAVESHREGTRIAMDPAATFNRVTEARIKGGEITLILEGGQSLSAAEVAAIRTGG
ncbi:hypothetical protein FGK63_17740 [Ruegeria sediminis]|uniref:Basal-body rod modification protein FlgD n=1 Tax=Ruegeria sediminis TaxID=2583820 RepID=A0ABY2WUK5_9RHOB|nr:flagellar hook capping FlgD N-terminal domain-containing protein [Ruegeria sediminis]TMV04921.1 hypothetical protein FGK63_17740 [Ruegeria sediminis]